MTTWNTKPQHSSFDAFIHIDAQKPLYVYQWRWEAEQKMQAQKGSGMTAEQVKTFIDGCKMSIACLYVLKIVTANQPAQTIRPTSCTRRICAKPSLQMRTRR
jgi:pantothenate kinase-related protein Tda10